MLTLCTQSQINARVKIAEQFAKGRIAVVVWNALQKLKRDSMFRGDVLGPVAFEVRPCHLAARLGLAR